MIGGLIALLFQRAVFSSFPLVIVFQILALGLFTWARLTFGRRSYHVAGNPTPGGLVTSGPYRHIRHPIYAAMCLLAFSAVLGHRSSGSFVCAILVFVSAVVRIFVEETLVAAAYPEYTDYKARTWRLIPYVF
jgi:protein-S-isoprenylcysteine O-methyltransferase Ste14